ncbi:MAG TPA: ATP-binding protein, partial [bacterium]|nr:ATP-binding protein [bacterium]
DGRRLTVLAHANPLFDDSGQLTGAVNVLVDISDRKAAENALRESDRRKNEFLAMLAHELRNPLAPIANAVELIRIAGSDPAMVEEARALIDRQLQQMVRLVDDLMDVSRISRNKLELRMERIDLVTAVRNALESVRPLIDAADHELVLALPDRPIPVDGDLVRLSQAFANLLNNAAKFTPACGRIAIKAAVEDGHAVVRVSDNGVGIPPESLPDIFEMFTQLDRGIERQHGGLGIGLTLVKELTEMHGGRVEAHSNGVGHGAEFVVHLPLAVPQSESQGTTAARPKGFGASSRHRILVVDDNRDSAHSLATLLRLQGHEVWTAYNGLDAVEAVESFQPAVILLDIGLPGLSGYEVAERIRGKHNGATPLLLAMTGWGQEEDRRRSRESGFAAHLVKPVSLDRILEFLEHLPLAAK